MRPHFAFSMGRGGALLARKAAFRLVWMTMSQSASLIRITSVSRVKPALLTSTSSRPHRFTTASTAIPGAALSAKSACSAIVSWPACESSSPRASASAWRLLYVIATVAPASPNITAVARPVPRLPPVTSTNWPLKPSDMDGFEQGVHAGQVFDIVDHRTRDNLLHQPGQGSPWTNLNVGVRAELLQPLDRLRPADWAGELADHQAADLRRINVNLPIGIEDLGATQRPERDLLPGGRKHLGRVGHQWRMERPAHRQPHQALCSCRVKLGAYRGQATLATGDHHLAGRIVVGDDHLAPTGRADLLDGAVRDAEHGDHSAGLRRCRRHRGAARPHGLERVQGIERLSRNQAGKLPHAVAGNQRRAESPRHHQPEHAA